MLHELFLATRQTAKIRKAIAKIMSTEMKKLVRRNCLKWFNWVDFFITHLAIPLARDNLLGLVSNWDSNAINKFGRKIRGKGAVRARKGFTLFISNEKTNNNIKIIKSLDDWNVLIDGIT